MNYFRLLSFLIIVIISFNSKVLSQNSLKGIVLEENGQPLAQVNIELIFNKQGTRTVLRASTNEFGGFEFAEEINFPAIINVSKEGYQPIQKTISESDSDDILIRLRKIPPPVTFTGRVVDNTGRVISQAEVEVYSTLEIGTKKSVATTDRNGVFRIREEITYPLRVLAKHPDYSSKIIQIPYEQNDPIELELESSLLDFSYRGKLISKKDQTPITNASLRFDDGDIAIKDLGEEVVTDANGEFELPLAINLNEPEREFYVLFRKDGYRDSRLRFSYSSEVYEVKVTEIVPQDEVINLTGYVIDITNNKPVELATVQLLSADDDLILSRPIGRATDLEGKFDFNLRMPIPYKLRVSHVSYETVEITIRRNEVLNRRIRLAPRSISGGDIVVTAEMISQEELKQPTTVDRISTVDIQQVASFNAFDLVSTLREVDVATQSMNLQSVTTRGFNSSANPRFLQLTDGVDNVAPGLGFPVGNLLGPSELDIASVDLLVGSSTARYGSSALNGVLITNSKSPFENQGFSFNVKRGFHNISVGGASAWAASGDGVFDASVRYAKSFNDKFAFKVSGTIIEGSDWRANNYDNIGGGSLNASIRSIPNYTGVNTYGDESFVILPVGVDENGNPDGSLVPVHRTGYREEDLVDYNIDTKKLSSTLSYKFNDESYFTIQSRYGLTNTLYTSDSRIRLEDFSVLQLKGDLKINGFQLLGYITSQNSGDSYNVNYLAEQLITDAKSDFLWFRDYRLIYSTGGISGSGLPSGDFVTARNFADGPATLLERERGNVEERFEPGTEVFDEKVDAIRKEANFESGAGIRDNSSLYNISAIQTFDDLNLDVGGSFRFTDLNSNGTLFPDTLGNDITNYEYGFFASTQQTVGDRLTLLGAIRLDKNESFDHMSSQQLGMNFEYSETQFFRLTLQSGFRYPTVREQFLNTNIGKARLLGGLSLISDPYELQNNSFFDKDVSEFRDAVSIDVQQQGLSESQAQISNLEIMENAIVTSEFLKQIKPERVYSLEVGSRSLLSNNLYLDVNYFVSLYQDFIGIQRVVKPRTSPTIDLLSAAVQSSNVTQSDRFFIYGNSNSDIIAQGLALDLNYSSGNFFTGFNGTWTNLISDSDDPIVPGYNTPNLKFNFDWGNRELITNVGFKMTFRYRGAHDWESSFLDGRIESYGHFDFQFNIRVPRLRSMVKTGLTNFGRENYYDVYGGPAIGTIVFMSFTYNPTIF